MIAGLPGTGIGGLCYLLLAVAMPVHRLWRSVRGCRNPEKERLVVNHMFLTLAIVVGMGITGWLLVLGLQTIAPTAAVGATVIRIQGFVPLTPFVLTSMTLVAIYLGMRVIGRLFSGRIRDSHIFDEQR
jgi:hypothetical protein